ncbi:hypothetical protein HXY32_06990 [Candidatus Bathyarchaeota archaeon]|nr:hypothetical protein [Candidatus Bathyarchaeota archaeon]
MAIELSPEFFLFLGIDLFVALALLTCVMEHFNRLVSYLYEAAAVFGYVNHGQSMLVKWTGVLVVISAKMETSPANPLFFSRSTNNEIRGKLML